MALPQRTLAAITLVALSSVLPELTTGTTRAEVLFRPLPLTFLVLTYGLPVLALREWAVRRRTGPLGVLIAGVGYGFVNQGLLARTIYTPEAPLGSFEAPWLVFGVNVGWLCFASLWLAVSAVLLPIAITETAWPNVAAKPFGGRVLPWLAVVPVLAVALSGLLAPAPPDDGAWSPGFVALVSLALVATGVSVRGGWWLPVPWQRWLATTPVLLGAGFALVVVAESRPDPLVLVGVIIAVVVAVAVVGRAWRWFTLPSLAYSGLAHYAVVAVAGVASLGEAGVGTSIAVVLCLAAAAGLVLRGVRTRPATVPPVTVTPVGWQPGLRTASPPA